MFVAIKSWRCSRYQKGDKGDNSTVEKDVEEGLPSVASSCQAAAVDLREASLITDRMNCYRRSDVA